MDKYQEQAFLSKIEISNSTKDCWNWTGSKKPSGYGSVRINKKYKLAHRVAFELYNGEIPSGYIVCHICDNRSCCNPSHMMLGTIKSNAADMILKGRGRKKEYAARGEKNGNAKLREADIIDIRMAYSSGEMSQGALAKKYNVTQPVISSLILRKTWRHIK